MFGGTMSSRSQSNSIGYCSARGWQQILKHAPRRMQRDAQWEEQCSIVAVTFLQAVKSLFELLSSTWLHWHRIRSRRDYRCFQEGEVAKLDLRSFFRAPRHAVKISSANTLQRLDLAIDNCQLPIGKGSVCVSVRVWVLGGSTKLSTSPTSIVQLLLCAILWPNISIYSLYVYVQLSITYILVYYITRCNKP